MRETFLDRDALWLGLLWGVFVPVVGYAVLEMLLEVAGGNVLKPGVLANRTRALIAICLNMIPLRLYRRGRYDRTVHGVIWATFGLAALWMYFFGLDLINKQ
jgi:hypothetical protein